MCMVYGPLAADLRGRVDFKYMDHTKILTDVQGEIRIGKEKQVGEILTSAVGGLYPADGRHIRRRQKKGAWLSVAPSTVNGTELGA